MEPIAGKPSPSGRNGVSVGSSRTDASAPRPRIDSIDLLRGLIMVIMALDHVRDHFAKATFDPTDLTQTTPGYFLTRWITHFCAPVFVLLAGTGARLSRRSAKSTRDLAHFLWTRGLWLIFLEFTVVRPGWIFGSGASRILWGEVLWAMGGSMVVLAGLVFLPARRIALVGIVLLAGHNLLDPLDGMDLGAADWLWSVLHRVGEFSLAGFARFHVGYPLLAWIAVLACGYALGEVFLWETERRRRFLVRLGFFAITGFVLLRAARVYGDPKPWQREANDLFTVFSFLNCTKYPPSLLFLLMTLGPSLLVLAWFERASIPRACQPLLVFGRVPLFYYLLHFLVIRGGAVAAGLIASHAGSKIVDLHLGTHDRSSGVRLGLPGVYLVWVVVVLAMYPACRWFAEIKRRHKSRLLSYL
jgi:uncharacterized membrane protein